MLHACSSDRTRRLIIPCIIQNSLLNFFALCIWVLPFNCQCYMGRVVRHVAVARVDLHENLVIRQSVLDKPEEVNMNKMDNLNVSLTFLKIWSRNSETYFKIVKNYKISYMELSNILWKVCVNMNLEYPRTRFQTYQIITCITRPIWMAWFVYIFFYPFLSNFNIHMNFFIFIIFLWPHNKVFSCKG